MPEGAPEGCRCWEPPHALGGLLCGRSGSPEGCAIALPRGCAGGVPLLETAACPGRPPMWAEGCAGGVCHSPAAGVRRTGCAGGVPLLGAAACPGRPPMWAGGVYRGYIGCRPFLCKEVLVLGAAACCCLDVSADWLFTWEPSQLVWWLLERSPEEGAGSVCWWYGGFQRCCSHATARNPHIYTTNVVCCKFAYTSRTCVP